MRPPPKPLDIANLQSMVAEAVVIASGTVTGLTQSRTLEGRVEVVTIHAILKPAIILKGNKDMTTIEVEESYRQFAAREAGVKSGAGRVIAMKAGPRPAVGSYEEGARLLLFLAPISGSKKYRPVGSGNYDAYLGVFHLTPEGVKAQGFALDKEVSAHSSSEPDFLDYVSSLTGGVK